MNNAGPKWTPYLLAAASDWSAAANIDYRVTSGSGFDSFTCAPVYGVVEICGADYGRNGWLGMTNVYTQGGHIVMATVRLNNYYPSMSASYSSDAWYSNTICHELGHVLGLNHEDETKNNRNSGSCMDLTYDPSGKKSGYGPANDLKPGATDYAALANIYKVPSGIQLASTFAPSEAAEVPEPAVWGLLFIGFSLIGTKMRYRQVAAVA